MKKLLRLNKLALFAAVLFVSTQASAQTPPSPVSLASDTINGKMLTVKYSAPSVRGRQIFGQGGRISQDRNYPVWRAGANSATAFHTDADLDIKGLQVPKGDYTLFVSLADSAQWELIISKQTGQWGLGYNKDMDLGRVKMDMSKPAAMVETLKYTFTEEKGAKAKLLLEWENYAASVPITVK
jgi:hypothetical protein